MFSRQPHTSRGTGGAAACNLLYKVTCRVQHAANRYAQHSRCTRAGCCSLTALCRAQQCWCTVTTTKHHAAPGHGAEHTLIACMSTYSAAHSRNTRSVQLLAVCCHRQVLLQPTCRKRTVQHTDQKQMEQVRLCSNMPHMVVLPCWQKHILSTVKPSVLHPNESSNRKPRKPIKCFLPQHAAKPLDQQPP
jgi:hypothetical protein